MLPRALIFDVDGTLYSQPLLRARLLPRLGWAALRRPAQAREMGRALAANRQALEELRGQPLPGPVPGCQLERAARLSGLEPERVAAYVKEWFEEMPLPLLAGCRRPGLRSLLEFARSRAIGLGVLSDYPAERKLQALGVRESFAVVLSAEDAMVQAYKPSPRWAGGGARTAGGGGARGLVYRRPAGGGRRGGQAGGPAGRGGGAGAAGRGRTLAGGGGLRRTAQTPGAGGPGLSRGRERRRGGKQQAEGGALAGRAHDGDEAATLLDDAVDARQAEAGAFADLLGGEKRLKDVFARGGVHADAVSLTSSTT